MAKGKEPETPSLRPWAWEGVGCVPSPWQHFLQSSGNGASEAGGPHPSRAVPAPALFRQVGSERTTGRQLTGSSRDPPCGAPYANVIICICKYANVPALVRAAGGEEREGVQKGAEGDEEFGDLGADH